MQHPYFYHSPSIVFILLAICAVSFGAPTNRTIDDQQGDSVTGAKPVYTGGWVKNGCSHCPTKRESIASFDSTWTTGELNVEPLSITFNFTGTAIYIFIVESNFPNGASFSTSSCDFHLDGSRVGNYQHVSDGTTSFRGHTLAYIQTSILNGDHTFRIELTKLPEEIESLFIFDHAVYTIDEADVVPRSSPSSISTASTGDSTLDNTTATSSSAMPLATSSSTERKNPKIGAIVGGAVGGFVGVALVALAIFFYRRRSRRNAVMSTRDMIDLTEGGEGEASIAAQDIPIRHIVQQQSINAIDRNGQQIGQDTDGLDVVTKPEEMRAQIDRPQMQKNSNWSSSSGHPIVGSTGYIHTPGNSASESMAEGNTTESRHTIIPIRRSSTMKDDQPASQEWVFVPRTPVYNDSGLRLNAQSELIELPATYTAK